MDEAVRHADGREAKVRLVGTGKNTAKEMVVFWISLARREWDIKAFSSPHNSKQRHAWPT